MDHSQRKYLSQLSAEVMVCMGPQNGTGSLIPHPYHQFSSWTPSAGHTAHQAHVSYEITLVQLLKSASWRLTLTEAAVSPRTVQQNMESSIVILFHGILGKMKNRCVTLFLIPLNSPLIHSQDSPIGLLEWYWNMQSNTLNLDSRYNIFPGGTLVSFPRFSLKYI